MTMRYKPLCLFAVLFPITAWAVVFGTLRGVVHDPDHRPVQKAQVVVKASSSDFSQELTTDSDGAFEATALPVGSYDGHRYGGWICTFSTADCCHFWQRAGTALPARDRGQERTSYRFGIRSSRKPGADDAHHHRQPQ